MVPKLLYANFLVLFNLLFVIGKQSFNGTEALIERDENFVNLISFNDSVHHQDIYRRNDGENVDDDYANVSSYSLSQTVTETFNQSVSPANLNVTDVFNVTRDNNNTDANENRTTVANSTVVKCQTCARREEDKEYRLQVLKNKIMLKLHFQEQNLPNISGRIISKMPRLNRLLQRFQIQSDSPDYTGHDTYMYDDNPYGQTERMFSIAKEPPENLPMNTTFTSYFHLPDETRDSIVKKATLWYYIKPTELQKTVIEVNIDKLKPPRNRREKHSMFSLKYWKAPPRKARYWHQLDIQKTVQQWVDKPRLNYGLQMVALDHNDKNLIVTPSSILGWEGYEPMIELKTIKRAGRRVKRDETHYSMRCSANSTESRCCRYPLRVNFVDFGWDWVIAPRDYSANYCSGECRYSQQDESHHSYMQQQATSARNPSTGPCCTPTDMSSLSMLYFDHDHTILFTHLPEMKVERCGCS